jgi:hypothetical protein
VEFENIKRSGKPSPLQPDDHLVGYWDDGQAELWHSEVPIEYSPRDPPRSAQADPGQ